MLCGHIDLLESVWNCRCPVAVFKMTALFSKCVIVSMRDSRPLLGPQVLTTHLECAWLVPTGQKTMSRPGMQGALMKAWPCSLSSAFPESRGTLSEEDLHGRSLISMAKVLLVFLSSPVLSSVFILPRSIFPNSLDLRLLSQKLLLCGGLDLMPCVTFAHECEWMKSQWPRVTAGSRGKQGSTAGKGQSLGQHSREQ